MTERTATYQGREIVYDEEVPKLSIDGIEIPVEAENSTSTSEGLYYSPNLHYERFVSLGSLAEAIIEHDDGMREE